MKNLKILGLLFAKYVFVFLFARLFIVLFHPAESVTFLPFVFLGESSTLLSFTFFAVIGTPIIVYHFFNEKVYKKYIKKLAATILAEIAVLVIILFLIPTVIFPPVGGDSSLGFAILAIAIFVIPIYTLALFVVGFIYPLIVRFVLAQKGMGIRLLCILIFIAVPIITIQILVPIYDNWATSKEDRIHKDENRKGNLEWLMVRNFKIYFDEYGHYPIASNYEEFKQMIKFREGCYEGLYGNLLCTATQTIRYCVSGDGRFYRLETVLELDEKYTKSRDDEGVYDGNLYEVGNATGANKDKVQCMDYHVF